MADYVKQVWADNDPTKPVSAVRLQHIEDGIKAEEDARKAALAPQAWIAPALQTNVSNFGTPHNPAGYKRDAGGNVRLQGVLAGSALSSPVTYPGQKLFQMPDGYRPTNEAFLVGGQGTGYCRVEVTPDGFVWAVSATSFVVLDGISFPAETFATVVCLGDSITNGFGTTNGGWPAQLHILLGTRANVVGKGVNGQRLDQCEARRTTDVDPWAPTYAILEAGVNDVMNDDTAATIQGRITTTMSAFIASGYIPIVSTLLPWKNYVDFTTARETVRTTVNNWLRAQTQWKVVDQEVALGDGGTTPALRAVYDSGDGLHPNNLGAVTMAQQFFAVAFGSKTI